MRNRLGLMVVAATAVVLLSEPVLAEFVTQWQLGAPGRGWPQGEGGVIFVQEANVNPPPGDPDSPPVHQQADDDYYVAGVYPPPINAVDDENVMERAFRDIDNDLRVHFNLPEHISPYSQARFSFEANSLDTDKPDPRYGIEIWFNGNLVHAEQIILPGDLNTIFTTEPFALGDVDAVYGPGGDNVLMLRGTNYSAFGGSDWLGMDYHHLEIDPFEQVQVPTLNSMGIIALLLAILGIGGVMVRRITA